MGDLHRFVLETPLEEPKGRAAQSRMFEDMAREIEDLKGRLGLQREHDRDAASSPEPMMS
eukprot:NODE_10059_length_347_cov_22.567114_g9151_i0.p1 GENE.NODE_10059_length_347_cov_22.567114_g9151_i0~~NODE_10059_length_347_cov_22.567114_g9151_i0.p1  ORF type:complete len:67 (+),score=22.81 NODE_10059_length_347_cov_22.567114_g9151_i0:24-203(+)